MTAEMLRGSVVAYLRPLAHLFADRLEGRFHGQYNQYLAYLSSESGWGDELTLMAIAHLTRRPIHVVTDSSSKDDFLLCVEPPSMICKTLWSPAFTVCCFMERHYDAATTVAVS